MRKIAHGGWRGVLGAVAVALVAGAFPAGGGEAEPLVVHEWGVLDIPATAADATPFDLPPFVLTWEAVEEPTIVGSMGRAPVVYLYPPAGLESCNVRVTFPTGGACAWWPAAAVSRSGEEGGEERKERRGTLRLAGPVAALDWSVTFGAKNGDQPLDEPPAVPEGHWMGFARDVDAPLLAVGPQREHFLFYEGTIDYANPVVVEGTGSSVVRNAGDHPLLDAMWISCVGGSLSTQGLGDIVPGATARIGPPPGTEWMRAKETPDGAERSLVSRLVAAGLFEKEALAMARTWRSAFFERPGVRIVYRLPQDVYDRLLPLTVTAGVPVQTTRVMLACRGADTVASLLDPPSPAQAPAVR